MEWSDEVIGQLRGLWAEGLSTAEIGRRLGVTKNAIVGKAHRLDLPARPSPIRRDPDVALPRRAVVKRLDGPTLPPLPSTACDADLAFIAVENMGGAPVTIASAPMAEMPLPVAQVAPAISEAVAPVSALPAPKVMMAATPAPSAPVPASPVSVSPVPAVTLSAVSALSAPVPVPPMPAIKAAAMPAAEAPVFPASAPAMPVAVTTISVAPAPATPVSAAAKPVVIAPPEPIPAPVIVRSTPIPSLAPRPVVSPVRPMPAPRPMMSAPRSYGRVVTCCWPIGEPGTRDFHFCDSVSEPGRPYCEEHVKVAYVRVRDRREDAA